MKVSRRQFLGTTAAGTVSAALPAAARTRLQTSEDIDRLYARAIVCDPLSMERWDEAGIAAWRKSGYTCIQTTLGAGGPAGSSQGEMWSEGNFARAMESLKEWNARIVQHPDVFIRATKAADIHRAKREGKLAVILGFQNAP